jgi:hypothetical protein
MSGAYIFPGDVSLSANFEQRSGDPWARQVSVTGGRTIPQNRQRVEPIGSRRLDTINILNLRGEKGFRLGGGRRIALQVNVYNALNINTATAVTPLSGPNFNIPSAITRPRLAEVMSFGEQDSPRPVLAIEGGPFSLMTCAAGRRRCVTRCGEGGVNHVVARLGHPDPFGVALWGLPGRGAAGGGAKHTSNRGVGWIQPVETAKGVWRQFDGREGNTARLVR